MKKTLFLLLLCFSFKSHACECVNILSVEWNENGIKESMENNDLIILGELISSTTKSYKFKVLEVFKGNLKKGDIIEGSYTSTCSGRPHPKRTGKWIFYGKYEKNENQPTLSYSSCGPTRSLYYPIIITEKQNQVNWKRELNLLNTKFKKNVELKIPKRN